MAKLFLTALLAAVCGSLLPYSPPLKKAAVKKYRWPAAIVAGVDCGDREPPKPDPLLCKNVEDHYCCTYRAVSKTDPGGCYTMVCLDPQADKTKCPTAWTPTPFVMCVGPDGQPHPVDN